MPTKNIPPRPSFGDKEVRRIAAEALAPDVQKWLGGEPDEKLVDVLVSNWSTEAYEFAKRLESNEGFSPDIELLDILDGAHSEQHTALKLVTDAWARENGISTKLDVGDRVFVHQKGRNRYIQAPDDNWTGEIVSIDRDHAQATVCFPAFGHVKEGNGTHGLILAWEHLEKLPDSQSAAA